MHLKCCVSGSGNNGMSFAVVIFQFIDHQITEVRCSEIIVTT